MSSFSTNIEGKINKVEIYDTSADKPWHLPIPSSTNGRASDYTEISTSHMMFVESLYKNNTIISTATDQFLSNVTKGGIDIKITVGNKTYEINKNNKNTKRYVRKEVEPQIEKILKDFLIFGYSRVRIVPSREKLGWPSFNTIKKYATKDYFYYTQFGWKEYIMKWNSTDNSYQSGQEVNDGMVLVFNEPDDQGYITSPVSQAAVDAAKLSRLGFYYFKSAFNRANPAFIFTPDPNVSKNLATTGPLPHLRNAASIIRSKVSSTMATRSSKMNEVERQNYAKSLKNINDQLAKKVTINIKHSRSSNNNIDSHIPKEIRTYEMERPWEYGMVTPVGQKLNNAPTSSAPEQYSDVHDKLTRTIWQKIGMPAEMATGIIGNKNNASGNVDHVHKILRDNIHAFQTKAIGLLETLLEEVWKTMIGKKIFADAFTENKAKNTSYLLNLKDNIKVEVNFNYNPILSYEMLHQLYVNGVLKPEAYQKYSLQLTGIPDSDKLQDMENAIVKRTKALSEAQSSGKLNANNNTNNNQIKNNNNNNNNNKSNDNNKSNNNNNNDNNIDRGKKRERNNTTSNESSKLSKKQKK